MKPSDKTKKLILLVEDDPNVNRLLGFAISSEGDFRVLTARTGAEALEIMRREGPQVVVLDIMLPDQSGLEVLRIMRADLQLMRIGVIFLSALGEEEDRIAGFEVGADDYLPKPFFPSELLLRVRAVLRRTEHQTGEGALSEMRVGELSLIANDYRAFFRGTEIHLTSTEYRLLSYLMSNENQVKSREMLMKELWGEVPQDAGRLVDSHVKRLRAKLGDAGEYIHTIYGLGYRFEIPASQEKRR